MRVLQCEKEVERYSNRKKIDSLLNYLLKMRAHRTHSTCWKLFQMRVFHSFIELINKILARCSVVFCKESKLNFRSLVCLKELLIGDSQKEQYLQSTLCNTRLKDFFVNIYRFIDLFYYILCAPKYDIYHITLHGGYLQLPCCIVFMEI